jgi:peptidoglycan/LPS O-acetylase OafA/YrhL
LNAPRPILVYVGQAVLPFYILHQTVLLIVGYYVVPWQVSDVLKWAVITTLAFLIILLVYEFGIRRTNVLRFLFGMKPLRPEQTATESRQGQVVQPTYGKTR